MVYQEVDLIVIVMNTQLLFLKHSRMKQGILLTTVLSLHISEIICYVVFFHHLYKHNMNILSMDLLSPQEIQKRNKANVLTFMNQFILFLFEISGIAFMFISMVFPGVRPMAALYTVTNPFMSVATVLTSNVLRQKLLNAWS